MRTDSGSLVKICRLARTLNILGSAHLWYTVHNASTYSSNNELDVVYLVLIIYFSDVRILSF